MKLSKTNEEIKPKPTDVEIIINTGHKNPGHIKDGDTVYISLDKDLKYGYHKFKVIDGHNISESSGQLTILKLEGE